VIINTRWNVVAKGGVVLPILLLTLAYGEYAMKKSSVFEQHKRFKEGRNVQDDPRSGQPKTQRTDANVYSSWSHQMEDYV
jgi:hypothetical protein